MRLVVAALVKNEAARFWRAALDVWGSFADEIVVLDDHSTDETVAIAARHPRTFIRRTEKGGAWGAESSARAQLFALACERAGVGNWVFVLDADMIPARDPRPLLEGDATEWAFGLYDLWSASEYRWDRYWGAHLHPRVWLFQVPEENDFVWSGRGIHCGHLPANWKQGEVGIAPRDFSILHYGYAFPYLRREKLVRYQSVGDQLSLHEKAHALSIADENPQTFPLPFKPDYTLTEAYERAA